MDRAGEKLKRVRERLNLTFRDVEQASQVVASRRASDEFAIALSRLADIENKGTVPSIYRIYTLCAIYRLDFDEVLRWYGVPREHLVADAMHIGSATTHAFQLPLETPVSIPPDADQQVDLRHTAFLSHLMRRWGKLPLGLLNGFDLRQHRYGYIGLEDWSMYPILHPGSLVAIDESRRRIADSGWNNELERPIYFLETREGYLCGWCSQDGGQLIVQAHPASHRKPLIFEQTEIDVIGQVSGVAMLLESRKRRHARSATAPEASPDR